MSFLNHISDLRKYNRVINQSILNEHITYMVKTSQLASCKTGKLHELAIKHN